MIGRTENEIQKRGLESGRGITWTYQSVEQGTMSEPRNGSLSLNRSHMVKSRVATDVGPAAAMQTPGHLRRIEARARVLISLYRVCTPVGR